MPRGARITLHMREDDGDYLEPERIRHIVKTYSDHIALPIVLEHGNKEETINTAAALWTRPRADITPEQYKEFYHHVGHAFDEPWPTLGTPRRRASSRIHHPAVRAVAEAVPDLFDPERKPRLKLYVRRVFITDEGTGAGRRPICTVS